MAIGLPKRSIKMQKIEILVLKLNLQPQYRWLSIKEEADILED
jgi:hypothetical protein